jgi:hypothetical protein
MRIMLHTTETRTEEPESRGGTRNWLPGEKMEAKDDEETSTQTSMGLRTRLRERIVIPYIARGSDRRTDYKEVTGQTPDISEWLDFEF